MVAFVAGGDARLGGRPGAEPATATPGALVEVRLLAPLVPPVILNSGQNYWDHRDEKPEVDQKEPEFFLKTPLAVIGPDEPVLYDSDRDEQARLRGRARGGHRQARAPHPGRAGARITSSATRSRTTSRRATARPFRTPGRLGVRARPRQELRHVGAARALDRHARRDPRPQDLELRTLVNEEIRQSNSTAKMIWSVAEIVAFFSHFYTLQPGLVHRDGTRAVPHGPPIPRSVASPSSGTTSSARGTSRSATWSESRSTASDPSRTRSSRPTRRTPKEECNEPAHPGRADPAHRLPSDRRPRRRARRERRRQGRGQPDHRGRPDPGLRRQPERQYARRRPRGEDPDAGADRGTLPHLVLGCPRAARPRSQAPRGADDGLRGEKCRAGAALRVHRRGERRRSPPDRRDDPRHGQGRRDPGPAHGGLGARHLRDLGMLDWNPRP